MDGSFSHEYFAASEMQGHFFLKIDVYASFPELLNTIPFFKMLSITAR